MTAAENSRWHCSGRRLARGAAALLLLVAGMGVSSSGIQAGAQIPSSCVVPTDGGRSRWTGTSIPGFERAIFVDVVFLDEMRGWVLSRDGDVFATSDGGSAWAHMSALSTQGRSYSAITFIGGQPGQEHGWAVGNHGAIWSTVDGGASWTEQRSSPNPNELLNDVVFDAGGRGHAVGDGIILNTVDYGNHWIAAAGLPPDRWQSFSGVFFADASTGHLVDRRAATISVTSDGGDHWSVERDGQVFDPFGIGKPGYSGVFFSDKLTGYVVGYGGEVVATNDGGQTWLPKDPCSGERLKNPPPNTVVDDGGQSKSLLGVAFIGGPNCPSAQPACNGIAAGNSGSIIRTTDGGQTWLAAQQTVTSQALRRVAYPSASTAYAVSVDGKILRGAINLLSLPHISRLDPPKGPTSGGTRVTITGSGFTDVTQVSFGPLAAQFEVDSDGATITAVSPAGPPIAVDVTVRTTGGQSPPASFRYEVATIPDLGLVLPSLPGGSAKPAPPPDAPPGPPGQTVGSVPSASGPTTGTLVRPPSPPTQGITRPPAPPGLIASARPPATISATGQSSYLVPGLATSQAEAPSVAAGGYAANSSAAAVAANLEKPNSEAAPRYAFAEIRFLLPLLWLFGFGLPLAAFGRGCAYAVVMPTPAPATGRCRATPTRS